MQCSTGPILLLKEYSQDGLFPQSVCGTPSSSTATVTASPPSSQSERTASSLSEISPFAEVLLQMVSTRGPSTAAAVVCSPSSSAGHLMAAPGSNAASPSVCSPSVSSGRLVAAPLPNTAASRIRSPLSGALGGSPRPRHRCCPQGLQPHFRAHPGGYPCLHTLCACTK